MRSELTCMLPVQLNPRGWQEPASALDMEMDWHGGWGVNSQLVVVEVDSATERMSDSHRLCMDTHTHTHTHGVTT